MALRRENAMKAVRDGLLPAFAASFTIASLVVPATPAKAAGWLTSSCTFAEANAALIFAVLAGFAAAFAILALIYRERARELRTPFAARYATRLDTLGDRGRQLPGAGISRASGMRDLAATTMRAWPCIRCTPQPAFPPSSRCYCVLPPGFIPTMPAGWLPASTGCKRAARVSSSRTRARLRAKSSRSRARSAAPRPCCGSGHSRWSTRSLCA